MAEFSSYKDLRDWLEDKPVEYAVVIAARVALRSIVWGFDETAIRDISERTFLIPIFRACASVWLKASIHTPVPSIFEHAEATLDNAARGVERPSERTDLIFNAALAAAHTATAGSENDGARRAASVVNYSVGVATASVAKAGRVELRGKDIETIRAGLKAAAMSFPVLEQINFDVDYLADGREGVRDGARIRDGTWLRGKSEISPRTLCSGLAATPLWLRQDGRQVVDNHPLFVGWRRVEAVLRGTDETLTEDEREAMLAENWGVWLDWYQRRIVGGDWNEALEVERVVSEEVPWDRWDEPGGIRAINGALRKIEEKHNPPAARIAGGELSAEAKRSRAEELVKKSEQTAETLQAVADEILNALDAFQNETGLNQRPAELEQIAIAARRLRRIGETAAEKKIRQLEGEIVALKADVEALTTPQASAFWAAFKAEHGKQTAVTLHKAIRFAVYSGVFYVFGEELSAKVLPEILKMFKP